MTLTDLCLDELYRIKNLLEKTNQDLESIEDLIFSKELDYLDGINEDGPGGAAAAASIGTGGGGVAYANASIGGMGAVSSPQPSQFAGSTIEPAYSAGGGKIGSGDISAPYNPGGRKKMFQKIPSNMDNRKGSSKRRRNKLLQGLKNVLSQRQDYTAGQSGVKKGKIMNFDQFEKGEFNRVTKVKQ